MDTLGRVWRGLHQRRLDRRQMADGDHAVLGGACDAFQPGEIYVARDRRRRVDLSQRPRHLAVESCGKSPPVRAGRLSGMMRLLRLWRRTFASGAWGSIGAHRGAGRFQVQRTARKTSKTLENPPRSQLFEQTEFAVAAFAAAGLREWRAKPVTVELFRPLQAMQEHLAGPESGAEPDLGAQKEAIVSAIAAAIRVLHDPDYSAARHHFGFTDTDEDSKPLGKVERETKAACCYGRESQAWYYKAGRSSAFYDKTPSEYVIALVTAALCGAADPQACVAQLHASSLQPRPTAAGRIPTGRRLGVLLLVLVGLCLALVVLAEPGPTKRPRQLPAAGSVVNATSGEVVGAPFHRVRPPSPGGVTLGFQLDACVEDAHGGCRYESAAHTRADLGDVVRFRLRLDEEYLSPVSELKLSATAISRVRDAEVVVVAEWNPPGGGHSVESTSVSTVIQLPEGFGGTGTHYLSYVVGSTRLYAPPHTADGEGELIARLPDGLFGSQGITFTAVPPCRACKNHDTRNVTFLMRVKQNQLGRLTE